MSADTDEQVGRVVDVVDLVADDGDIDQEDVLLEALSRVRKRGDQQ